jgi:hypothetical protein
MGHFDTDPTTTFDEDCSRAISLRAEIAKQQEELKRYDERIMQVIFGRGETTHKSTWGSWSIQNRTTDRLDRAALLAHGVDMDIIKAATKTSVSDPFLVFRVRWPERE